MKSKLLLASFLALALVGCKSEMTSNLTPKEPPASRQPRVSMPAVEGYAFEEPVSVGNVTLVAIRSTRPDRKGGQLDQYMTLEQASKLGLVEVSEVPEEIVEKLRVTNKGEKPLLLVGGDLVKGGKQDRVVARDVIIPPGKTMDIDVFCVEQGRWSGETESFQAVAAKAPTEVRSKVAFAGDQGQVWQEVDRYNEASTVGGVQGGAGAQRPYGLSINNGREAAKMDSEYSRRLTDIRAALQKEELVGLAVFKDGKLISTELFGSPALFRSSLESIVSAIASDISGEAKSEADQPDVSVLPSILSGIEDSAVAGPRKRSTRDGEASELFAKSGENDTVLVHGYYIPKKQ